MFQDRLPMRYEVDSAQLSGISLTMLGDGDSDRFFEGDGEFLGRFTTAELQQDLLRLGILEHLQSRGYGRLELEIIPARLKRSRLRIWDRNPPAHDSGLLFDLIVWRELAHLDWLPDTPVVPALGVERLELRSPLLSGQDHGLAPGQSVPGLGAGLHALALLRIWAARIGAQLIVQLPEFFHTAAIFTRAFRYIDPEMQGLFDAAVVQLFPQLEPPARPRDRTRRTGPLEPPRWLDDGGDVLLHWTPADVTRLSRAFEAARVTLNGETWLWPTEAQVLPENGALQRIFQTPRWQNARRLAREQAHFNLDA